MKKIILTPMFVLACMAGALTQNVGIGINVPTEKLTVKTLNNSYGISHRGDGGNFLATFMGGTSAGIGTFSNTNMRIYSNGVGAIFIASGSNNVGIGVDFPSNKLQVGSVGNSGFATNHFAIGNGTAAFAIYQTNESTLMGSTVDIILKPRNNGQGRVGINTNTPRASLDVTDNVVIQNGIYAYMNGTSDLNGIGFCNPCSPQVSIIASYGVYAAEFDTFSDARIKNITGSSNAVKDLETINAIQVKDYTMKDKVKYGNKPYKKVIAQELEEVYPQLISKHTDFIPNVYQPANAKPTADGLLLSFNGEHHISATAKKLRVMMGVGKPMEETAIISIPSDSEVVIKTLEITPDRVFVYGEEVDDFRTVDYEGLATLNISATQQLSKLVKEQQATIEEQNRKLKTMQEDIKMLHLFIQKSNNHVDLHRKGR
jgi:hypothetical protein